MSRRIDVRGTRLEGGRIILGPRKVRTIPADEIRAECCPCCDTPLHVKQTSAPYPIGICPTCRYKVAL